MTKFQVRLAGENVWVALDHEPRHLGFFTTRFVEAADPLEAEQIAIDLVRADLRDRVLNDRDDPPRLVVEEILELAAFPSDVKLPGNGYTWYRDEKAKH